MKLLHKLADWYFSKRTLPYWCILLLDSACVFIGGFLGCTIEYGFSWMFSHPFRVVAGLLLSLVLFIVFFRIFHTYSGIIRFSSFVDLQKVGLASFFGSLCTLILGLLFSTFVPSSVNYVLFPGVVSCLVLFLSSTLMMWLVRVIVKRVFETFNLEGAIPVAIYGTKAGGISIANSIQNIRKKKYTLRAFITDGAEMKNSYLMGKRVYLNGPDIGEVLSREGVRAILVSPLKTDLIRSNQGMIDDLIAHGIRIMMMSSAEEWDGKSPVTHNQLHEVEIEDLLPREKIEVDMGAIGTLLRGRRILITGAAGSIGSEMVRQIASFLPSEMVLVDQAETPMHDIRLMMTREYPSVKCLTVVTSITNHEHMRCLFSEHRPEYVFHAAAYKHVPMMEDNPSIAVQNNIYGTRVIADLAVEFGTRKFVMISTDKAVNPTNVMGCSKRICEIYCQSLNQAIQEGRVKGVTQFVTTRFGNVLGSNGSVIPIFKEQIRRGGPVTVTHPDIIRYFMLIPEACRLVLEAGTMGRGGEIFVFDMGQPVKIVDLAKRMIALSGAQGMEIKYTGLRDGEKLYEEVLSDQEGTIPTTHPKIMVAKVREYDYTTALANEERLLEMSRGFDDMATVKLMKEIVPEYKSRSSKYEILDK